MHQFLLIRWSWWIKFLSAGLIIYGLAMVFAPQMMSRTLVIPLIFENSELLQIAPSSINDAAMPILNMMSGLLGTVTVGWAVQMIWIAHKPFRSGETWAWNALAVSVSSWAMLEFYFKLTNGIKGLGLFAHFSLLAAFAIPLLATYRYFHPMTAANNRPFGKESLS